MGINYWFVSLAKKQAVKNFAANTHVELTTRPPPPPSKLTETRGSIPLFSLDGYVMPN